MIAHPALPPLCRAGHTAGRSRVCASGRAYCLAGWCCTPLCCGWGGVVGPASRQAGAGRQAEGFAFAARLPHMALVHPPTPPATHPHRLSPMHLHTSCPPRLASPLFFTSGPHRPAAAPRLPHPGARRQRRRRLHGCPGARRRDKGGGVGGCMGGWAGLQGQQRCMNALLGLPLQNPPCLPACLPDGQSRQGVARHRHLQPQERGLLQVGVTVVRGGGGAVAAGAAGQAGPTSQAGACLALLARID